MWKMSIFTCSIFAYFSSLWILSWLPVNNLKSAKFLGKWKGVLHKIKSFCKPQCQTSVNIFRWGQFTQHFQKQWAFSNFVGRIRIRPFVYCCKKVCKSHKTLGYRELLSMWRLFKKVFKFYFNFFLCLRSGSELANYSPQIRISIPFRHGTLNNLKFRRHFSLRVYTGWTGDCLLLLMLLLLFVTGQTALS